MHYYRCDLTDFDELQSIAAHIRKDVGEPTIAIANAGICRGKPILTASKKDIEL
jgi:all-trans-retinol dehydrogenase (NAD+)